MSYIHNEYSPQNALTQSYMLEEQDLSQEQAEIFYKESFEKLNKDKKDFDSVENLIDINKNYKVNNVITII